jgi:hypothetical protein
MPVHPKDPRSVNRSEDQEGKKVTSNHVDGERAATEPRPERRSRPTGLMVIPVLAMLLIFSAIGLRWGLEPAMVVGTAVTLAAAAARISRGSSFSTAGPAKRLRRTVLHLAADLATHEDRNPERGPRE